MARILSMEVVKSIYKYAEPNGSAFLGKTSLAKMAEERPVSWLSYASEFQFGCCMKLAQMCCCQCLLRRNKVNRMLNKGKSRVDNILDVRTIV